jgi:hypothetical protein
MELYDPTVAGPERNSSRAPPLISLESKTVGYLHNSKLNAVHMLRETAELFAARHGCKIAPIYSKFNASAPAPTETLQQAADEIDFLITGLGD